MSISYVYPTSYYLKNGEKREYLEKVVYNRRDNGVYMSKYKLEGKPELVENIRRKYKEGVTIKRIKEDHDVSYYIIKKIIDSS